MIIDNFKFVLTFIIWYEHNQKFSTKYESACPDSFSSNPKHPVFHTETLSKIHIRIVGRFYKALLLLEILFHIIADYAITQGMVRYW